MASNVYTKTGDKGSTSLYTGERVRKSSLRVDAYGTIDELQSCLGVARAFSEHKDIQQVIYNIEKTLWLLMADIASMGKEPNITEDNITELEHIIDSYEAKMEPLTKFIVPGDKKSSALLHQCRTVTRRAERALWRVVDNDEPVHAVDIRYLNRLSDCCYMLARAEFEL